MHLKSDQLITGIDETSSLKDLGSKEFDLQKRKVTEDFDERKCASKKLTYERNLKRE